MSIDNKDVLEQNVSTLLETGGESPKLNELVKARIRAKLIIAHGADAPPKVARKRSPLVAVGIGLAATAAAALIVTRVVGHGGDAGTGTGGAIVNATNELADGSTWIAVPGAKVTVLGDRHLRVEGAALLDVAPGKGTFVVETRRGRIEVLGTRFLVDAGADRTTAAVVRGTVKLASADGDVMLHAGEQGVAEPGRPPSRGPAPRLSHLVSWAAQARHTDEKDIPPIHHGTLFARDPGVRSHPPWGEEYPLPIKKLGVNIVVENQVARVALDQTFHNDADQTLEGVYRFAIPPDAALQRLAMYVDGKLTESAVVERMRARRIYEELVYRRVDPALLEWAGTGRLSLRVYPLPARQDKRLMIAYTQSLPKLYSDWTLSVPLPEIDQPVGEVAFDVTIKGCANCEVTSTSHKISVQSKGEDALVSYHNTSETIGDSLVLHVRDARQQTSVARDEANGESYMMVRTPAELPKDAQTYRPRTWVILDDVSASRGSMERRAQADLIDAFMHELDEEDKVSVIAFDVTARQKLAPTRVLDVDRHKLRSSLQSEGDVGATDFGAALDAASKVLSGVAPEDAMLVYLGDGVITSGPKNLDALRAQLVGKMKFIGVGVGDGPDTQTLETLAAATGGYATTIDLADDVAWRAFDLIAALHTTRVTGLEARLVDATGALVPSALYLKSPQLADGEELEVVAKLAGGKAPTAVELTGTLNGAPWTRTISIPTTGQTGGYLPRTWAQRHIAARLLAKHEAIAMTPCTPGPRAKCPTEAEVRETRDEQIRQEVVGLGKKYFLLSRHTSLLVLENDAMYAQYGVAKGAGETWAPYAMPAKIPLVTTPAVIKPSDVAEDAELVRAPLQVFYNYGSYGGEFGGLDDLESTRGLGNFGTIGHGAGTGSGYGVGGAVRTRTALGLGPTVTDKPVTAISATAQPSDGTVTAGADAAREQAEERVSAEIVGVKAKAGKGDGDRWDGNEHATRRAVSSDEITGAFGYGRGGGTKGGGWIGGRELNGKAVFWSGPMVPQRFSYPTDQAFDDLTAFVPALLSDDSDAWRERLAAGAGDAKTHPIDDAAKALLTRARAAMPSGVYRWNGLEVAVDDAHRMGWRRTTDADLAETASFDGSTWTRRYAELGLDVSRTFTDDDIALSLAYLPVWIAEPAHYARWFEVHAKGRQLTLSRAAKPAFVLDFDDKDHLVAIHDGDGTELLRIMWGDVGPAAAKVMGEGIEVGFSGQAIGDAASWAHNGAKPGVLVELPAHLPAYWQAKLTSELPGSPRWRRVQRQLMASFAAVGNRVGLFAAYEALRANGGVETGDLTLASGGIATGSTDAQFVAALAALGDPRPAVARYLIAGRAYSKSPRPERLAADTTSGLVGALWQLRHITALYAASQSKAAVDELTGMGSRALQLRIIAAAASSNRYDMKPDDIGRIWDSVAVGPYKNVARAQAALAMANRNAIDAAVERVSNLIADLDLKALPPRLDQLVYRVQQSRRGPAGWQLIYTAWRDRVLAGSSYDHVISLVPAAQQQTADLPAIFARAVELAGSDVDKKVSVARMAINYGLAPFAQSVIEPLLKQKGTRELYQLAAAFALQQARTADALGYLESAQAVAGDEAVEITTVRAELTQIITVSRDLAIQRTGAQRDAVVAKAMAWGAKWRAIDAGNTDIDQQLGELQLAVGNIEEAWRQLSTVIERDPMAGTGYSTVAETFERRGKVAEALPFWQQAIVIDQTNPTPRLRKAQALIALGRSAEGDALLQEIVNHKWHDIWSNVPYQAKYLLERGKAQSSMP